MDNNMQYCNNEKCANCFRYHTGDLVCGLPYAPPFARWSKDMRPDILQCMAFQLTERKNTPSLQPGRKKDGSYPGQLKLKAEGTK